MTAALYHDPAIRVTHMPEEPILSTVKVLIVDDDEAGSFALANLVKKQWQISIPLEVCCVHTMADGLRESVDANVTILDLNLPDSGVEQTIQSIRKFPPPVLVMTGDDDPVTAAKCAVAGANGTYIKGFLIGFIPDLFQAVQQDIVRRYVHGPQTQ